MVIIVISMAVLFFVATFVLLVGTLFFLLSGRRPRFQMHTAGWPGKPSRRPMKDVTPHNEESRDSDAVLTPPTRFRNL
jgi:hypothetical protein